MRQKVKRIKWVRCWQCRLPIVVQVGDAIQVGTTVQCPECGKTRTITANGFMKTSEIPEEWRKAVLESIGVEGIK